MRIPLTPLLAVQIVVAMRHRGVPLAAVSCMYLVLAIARAGAWPLAEELFRCSLAQPNLFHRLDGMNRPEESDGVLLDARTRALLHTVRRVREGAALMLGSPGAIAAHSRAFQLS